MPNTTNETLPFLSSQERLNAYQLIVDGCSHLWSKNKLQETKLKEVLGVLIPLTKNDPYFLARLTSYALTQTKSKDLQVLLSYVSTLSSADGTPFSKGSKYVKPNLRYIGAAALHMLDPKLVDRVLKVANLKFGVQGYLNEAQHKPNVLRTAIHKYLEAMNQDPQRVTGIKKTGLGGVLKRLYVASSWKPSEEAVRILRWKRNDMAIDFGERLYNFDKKTDLEIAKIIRKDKIPYLGAMGELARTKKKVSPVIAVAMLEQATGNQAVIMRKTFEDAGILSDPEVKALYEKKIKGAKTALDRVDTIAATASEDVKKIMEKARAEKRQSETVGIGKIFVHLDDSGSMQAVRDTVIQRGSVIAECVNNPSENFAWGLFGKRGIRLDLPREFVSDAFAQALFGKRDGGSTNCFALYAEARAFRADVDVFITDQLHTDGDLALKIRQYHAEHPLVPKPRAVVIVNVAGNFGIGNRVKLAYEANEIPVVEMRPEALVESALVVDAVKNAVLGPIAIVDQIMDTPLLVLPSYYYTV